MQSLYVQSNLVLKKMVYCDTVFKGGGGLLVRIEQEVYLYTTCTSIK